MSSDKTLNPKSSLVCGENSEASIRIDTDLLDDSFGYDEGPPSTFNELKQQLQELKMLYKFVNEEKDTLLLENRKLKQKCHPSYQNHADKLNKVHAELMNKIVQKQQEKNELLEFKLQQLEYKLSQKEGILKKMKEALYLATDENTETAKRPRIRQYSSFGLPACDFSSCETETSSVVLEPSFVDNKPVKVPRRSLEMDRLKKPDRDHKSMIHSILNSQGIPTLYIKENRQSSLYSTMNYQTNKINRSPRNCSSPDISSRSDLKNSYYSPNTKTRVIMNPNKIAHRKRTPIKTITPVRDRSVSPSLMKTIN